MIRDCLAALAVAALLVFCTVIPEDLGHSSLILTQ